MATKGTIMRLAEATVMVRDMGTNVWRVSLDLDPVQIPVLAPQPGTDIPALTDAWGTIVISLVDAMENAEADSGGTLEYTAVWADCGFEVKAICAECETHFPIGEGWTTDVVNVPTVQCGCVDDDEDI